MPRVIDLTGQRFGRLVVIERDLKTRGTNARWRCRCDCGAETTLVISGPNKTQSCGCLKYDIGSLNRTHGLSRSRTYKIWKGMKYRCLKTDKYAHVSVCEQWSDFNSFYQDMGECPEGHSIDRIDPWGNYEPSNCQWLPLREQPKNKRNSHYITHAGKTMLLTEWARSVGIKPNQLSYRIKRGWPIAQALGLEPQTPRAEGRR